MAKRLFSVMIALLVGKVTVSVVLEYRNYFPPNFESDFLVGRRPYFWGAYSWAFYAHVLTGPVSLVLGLIQMSTRFRRLLPAWHRRLGRVQVACVLLVVAPSGLWMAWYAATGAVAGAGLGALAIATAACVALGWKSVLQRRYSDHERWMRRTFLLLFSAVIIRLVGGLATVTQFDAVWLYPLTAWASWLAPLLVFEAMRTRAISC